MGYLVPRGDILQILQIWSEIWSNLKCVIGVYDITCPVSPNHYTRFFQIWSCRIDNLKPEGMSAVDWSIKFSKALQLHTFTCTKSYESHPCITFPFKSKYFVVIIISWVDRNLQSYYEVWAHFLSVHELYNGAKMSSEPAQQWRRLLTGSRVSGAFGDFLTIPIITLGDGKGREYMELSPQLVRAEIHCQVWL